jgi:hypothetical protein
MTPWQLIGKREASRHAYVVIGGGSDSSLRSARELLSIVGADFCRGNSDRQGRVWEELQGEVSRDFWPLVFSSDIFVQRVGETQESSGERKLIREVGSTPIRQIVGQAIRH